MPAELTTEQKKKKKDGTLVTRPGASHSTNVQCGIHFWSVVTLWSRERRRRRQRHRQRGHQQQHLHNF